MGDNRRRRASRHPGNPPSRKDGGKPAGEDLGLRVRETRKRLGLSLDELAAKSGVSRAMLSDVERGAKSPTIKIARGIATGLGCSLSELVAGDGAQTPFVETTKRPTLLDPDTGIVRQSIAPATLARGLEVLAFTFPPGTDTSAFPLHPAGTLKVVIVIEGRLQARTGDREQLLKPGDSLTFPSSQPYLLANPGKTACKAHILILHPSR